MDREGRDYCNLVLIIQLSTPETKETSLRFKSKVGKYELG